MKIFSYLCIEQINKTIMARFGRYKMLLGEPCRLYHYNHHTNDYEFIGIGYYIGNGFCVRDNFTDIRDNLTKGITPCFLHYDRYIPTRLWNTEYQYAKEKGVLHKFHWNLKEILLPDFGVEDFNTDAIVDYNNDSLNEFWWWHEIQQILLNEILRK